MTPKLTFHNASSGFLYYPRHQASKILSSLIDSVINLVDVSNHLTMLNLTRFVFYNSNKFLFVKNKN